MQSRSSKIAALILGVVVLVVVSTILFTNKSTSVTTIDKVYTVPDTFIEAQPFHTNTLVTNNGRAFIEYNYKTGKSTQLSADFYNSGLDGITDLLVSESKNYLVFRQRISSLDSSLEKRLKEAGMDDNEPHWWVYNIAQKTFQPVALDQDPIDLKLYGDELFALTEDRTKPQILTFNLQDVGSVKTALTVPPVGGFFKVKDGFLLTRNSDERGSDILSTKDGTVSTLLMRNAEIVGVRRDGQIVITTPADGGNTLALLDPNTKEQTNIATNVSANIGWSPDGTLFYTTQSQNNNDVDRVFVYNGKTATTWKFSNEDLATTNLQPSAALNGHTAVLTTSNNITYLAGTDVAKTKTLPNNFSQSVQVGNRQVDMQYSTEESALLVSIYQEDAAKQQQAVYTALRDSGFNPDIITIRFTVIVDPKTD